MSMLLASAMTVVYGLLLLLLTSAVTVIIGMPLFLLTLTMTIVYISILLFSSTRTYINDIPRIFSSTYTINVYMNVD